MKVKTWVEFEQEIEVEVSIADVMLSIEELIEPDQLPMTIDCISRVHRVLLKIPDHRIAAMQDNQRKIIGEALRKQADRYMKGPA